MNQIVLVLVFLPFLGALCTGLISFGDNGKKGDAHRNLTASICTIIECLIAIGLLMMYAGSDTAVLNADVTQICGFGLHFTLDGFRLIYGAIAGLMWMMTTLFSAEYQSHHENKKRFLVLMLLTLGATMGVFLSADLYTTFIFFEIMSFTSYVWVAQEETEGALRAADTYLAVAVTGGLVMLMGIFLLYNQLGTLMISELHLAAQACTNKGILYLAGGCMVFGFGAKAGAFPLHIWLPKAHPVAPAPASALLSGILTKTGVYGIIIVSAQIFLHDPAWGKFIEFIGVCTMLGGAVLAVFSIDFKRTLACSSMSQIGFILVGVGMMGILGEENALAIRGTFLHMCNHSLIKLVLFMAAGVIYMNTHSLNLNEIRGWGRKKNLLKGIFFVGALAIAGIPGLSGYISKTLLHESIVEYHAGGALFTAVEWIFLFSGGLTLAYMTKLFVCVFVEPNNDPNRQAKYDAQKNYMNPVSTFALTASGVVLLVWGVCSHFFMEHAATMAHPFFHFFEEHFHEVHYFGWECLKGGLISIVIGAVVYLFFVRKVLMKKNEYVNLWPKWYDTEDLFYRPLMLKVLPGIFGFICKIFDGLVDYITPKMIFVGHVFTRICDSLVDAWVVFLRRTIYRDSLVPIRPKEGNMFTASLAEHKIHAEMRKNARNGQPDKSIPDYVHIYAEKMAAISEDGRLMRRSLSYGLLLFCVGFFAILFYLILS